jgi:cellulose synthase/poly-beta-1,6-N-acetylglucosamine synthase-like glycosyltransferase
MKISEWLVGVVVPARDEEDNIEECVGAIRAAIAACPLVRSSSIVVVADSCHDRTAARACASLGDQGEVIECEAKSPGTARRIGAAAVLRRFQDHARCQLWIANTDADSRPTSDWITQQLQFAQSGYAGVAGVVQVESVDGLAAREVTELFEYYVMNEDGSHPHVHGANLGIRADAYLDAGGWNDLALAEDHCLWTRVKARHWQTIASTSSVVLTSGRLVGRATGGFADSLRQRMELRYA